MRTVLFENITGKVLEELDIPLRLKEDSRIFIENKFSGIIRKRKGWICVVSLYDQKNDLIYRNCYCNKRWKYLILPKPAINLQRDQRSDQTALQITASELALFQDFYHSDFAFSPRGLVLLPGESRRIYYTGSLSKEITISKIQKFNLNQYLLA